MHDSGPWLFVGNRVLSPRRRLHTGRPWVLFEQRRPDAGHVTMDAGSESVFTMCPMSQTLRDAIGSDADYLRLLRAL